jgi:predicted protein tyrosine phosphatase
VPTIHVCPLHDLHAEAARLRPSAVVTLLSPLPGNDIETPPGVHADRHLRRFFHDITAPDPAYTAPSVEDVEAVIDFARRWDRAAPMLIHCWAGVSRSTAAAYISAIALHPDLDDVALAQRLRAASPTATPNAMMIAFADQILARDGRMITAIQGIGRGLSTDHGQPFVVPI